ncbi:MAG: class I SAM-dependent methyltransferase [Chloroflexia bacterium]|nr:class I SAM-dependent methyltransferase [Chloroflexia bacterium]
MTVPEPAWLQQAMRREADLAFRRRVRTVLAYLQPQPHDRILDGGCGRGFYLNFLQRLGAEQLYGLDLDETVLDKARRNLPPSIHLLRGSATELPFPEAFFDKVILSEVLEHLPDDRAGLQEAYRVLRGGGVLAITVPHADYPFWWDPVNKSRELLGQAPIREGFWAGIWAFHERLYTAQELTERVQQAGFVVEEVRTFTHYCFPFTHNLVYGIGKEVLEKGWLPGWLSRPADRFHYADAPPSRWNPLSWALALFDWIDRFNDHAEGCASYVNLALKARKPG